MNESVIVGITGHQKRRGLDYEWVSDALRAELTALGDVSRALSSLAAGADPRFATAALELNIPVTAVLRNEGIRAVSARAGAWPAITNCWRGATSSCSTAPAGRTRRFSPPVGTSSIIATFYLPCGTECQRVRWAGPAMSSNMRAACSGAFFTLNPIARRVTAT